LAKWPRKRPRDPGGPGSSAATPARQPSSRNRFTLFKRTAGVPHGTLSAPSNGAERRSVPALDTAALTAKTILIACDAPIVGVLKPFAGMADLVCQRAQTVGSNKEATASLEQKARHVADMIGQAVTRGSVVSNDLDEIVRTLDEIALYSDSVELPVTESNGKHNFATNLKHKFGTWISAPQEQDRIRSLDARLDAALNIFNLPSELVKFFHRTDTSIKIAIFSYCAEGLVSTNRIRTSPVWSRMLSV
ncbi:hypothetical protein DFH09DRAFT_1208111, partial [Mycena vulgaris]